MAKRARPSRDIIELRVLDSACGSGSFLIYAYQVLRDFYKSEFERLDTAYKDGVTALAAKFGDTTLEENVAVKQYEIERERIRPYPRIILETHLYGVDLDPQAAEIAVVNLMMRALEGQNSEKRLPLILNQNVKVGNALIGLRPDDERLTDHAAALAKIRQLRLDLKSTINTDPKHDQIMRDLETAKAALYSVFEADFKPHFSDLDAVRLFHWAVEFPECFVDTDGKRLDNSGFQVIIGNPPWEIVKPDLREFYAQFDPDIEQRLSRAKAEARIAELDAADPKLKAQWEAQKANIEAQAAYYRASDDYSKQGRGDRATHKLFMERAYDHLLAHEGRLGYVVPSGIYTDLGTKQLREMLLNDGNIQSLISITNGASGQASYFTGVHRSYKITLLVAQKGKVSDSIKVLFSIDPHDTPPPDKFDDFVNDKSHFFEMKREAIKRFSPDSLSIMEFKSQITYQVAEKIYANHPLLGETLESGWNVKFTREFDITNDRHRFNTRKNGLPLYQGRMFHQYDAFYSEPQYWAG
ncbi:MAG: hypothetical protein Q9P01_06790 [Anaerolineae bacterium]|nr:hypothetical protein [Anaerolineae bacterium]